MERTGAPCAASRKEGPTLAREGESLAEAHTGVLETECVVGGVDAGTFRKNEPQQQTGQLSEGIINFNQAPLRKFSSHAHTSQCRYQEPG